MKKIFLALFLLFPNIAAAQVVLTGAEVKELFAYLIHEVGYECGEAINTKQQQNYRKGFRNFSVRCLEKTGAGKGVMRSYLVTMKNGTVDKWAEKGRVPKRLLPIVSPAPY
jgi:hypothetical protein